MTGIKQLGSFAWVLLMFVTAACGAELDVAYVKTLGQTNATGEPLKGTGCRQIAVDPQGNLIVTVGIGHPWTALVKIGPNGKVIWETRCGGYADLPVAVADDFVYAVSPGFLLQRYSLGTGMPDKAWGYVWAYKEDVLRGVRKLQSASGIVVAGNFVFVSDNKAKTIRRFDRSTSAEKPFPVAIAIDEPLDIAAAKNGNLLVLTDRAVLELDSDGKLGNKPLIGDLGGPQSLEVDPFTGDIFVALGGLPGKRINQIWQYSAEGKPTGAKLGRGGEFNGPWTPDTFGICTGHADFTLDASGGFWVNTGLGQLVHFTAAPEFRHDQTIVAINDRASDIAADSDLNVYLAISQGQLKLSWENEVKWTSHVWPGGDAKLFPGSPVYHWPVYVAYAGKKEPVFHPMHTQSLYTLSPQTGQLVGTIVRPGFQLLASATSTGEQLYAGGGEKDGWKIVTSTHETFAKWTPYLTPPAPFQGSLVGVSHDKQRTYLWHNQQMLCIDSKGGGWRAASPAAYGRYAQPVAFLDDDVIFLNGEDHELVARDARTGQLLCKIGDKDVGGRPAVSRVHGLSVASKEGTTYLFALCNHQIQVFEVTFRK